VCCIALANLLLRYVATLARQCGVMEYRKTGEIFILYGARVCMCVCVTDSKLSAGKSIVIKTENQTVYREPQCDYSFSELRIR